MYPEQPFPTKKNLSFSKNKMKKKKSITLFLLAQLELVAVDSKRIAICKEFQPALLKIASSQFLGGSGLSGAVLKANWRASFPSRAPRRRAAHLGSCLGIFPTGN